MTVADDITAALADADVDWMADGACRQSDPELWFPQGRGHTGGIRTAKRICNEECPVKNRCLDYALAYDERWGIWGGVNFTQTRQRDRRRLRDERGVNLIELPFLPLDQRRRTYKGRIDRGDRVCD